MKVFIAGATGNLGSLLAQHLAGRHELRLLVHKRQLAESLAVLPGVSAVRGDLGDTSSLTPVCANIDCVVHVAGVLFAPNPERFLPETNVAYVKNLLSASLVCGIKKFILISFPHVEGETTPESRATDRQDRIPNVVHFRTRLEAEKLVLQAAMSSRLRAVILRAGVVYGKGVKLIEAAKRLGRYRLLAVWNTPTWVHLIALPDFLASIESAIENKDAANIYNICDDCPITLQDFLDRLMEHYGYPRPWRLPVWFFRMLAAAVEEGASVLGTSAPLTRDIIAAGMTSSVADPTRTRRELLPALQYPSLNEGIRIL